MISPMLVDWVPPYTSAMPYKKKAEAKPPSTKYFRPASWLVGRSRSEAANTYRASDNVSSPRNNRIRSLADPITIPPVAATSIKAYTSGASLPARCSSSPVTRATSSVAAQIVIVMICANESNATARPASVATPSSLIVFHWKIAKPPPTAAVSAVNAAYSPRGHCGVNAPTTSSTSAPLIRAMIGLRWNHSMFGAWKRSS